MKWEGSVARMGREKRGKKRVEREGRKGGKMKGQSPMKIPAYATGHMRQDKPCSYLCSLFFSMKICIVVQLDVRKFLIGLSRDLNSLNDIFNSDWFVLFTATSQRCRRQDVQERSVSMKQH